MKKKNFPCFYGFVFCCFLFCSGLDFYAQKNLIVYGTILNSVLNSPLENVLIRVNSIEHVFVYSDSTGDFSLKAPFLESFEIDVSVKGFTSQKFRFNNNSQTSIHMGVIVMFEKQEEHRYSFVLDLSKDDLLQNDIGGANVITGLLQSSKDVFIRTAAFNFGQARFKIRGYDSQEATVLFNGIKMNKVQTGRPNWSNWGGLNDVLRNLSFSNGVAPTQFSFGSLMGVTNFNTRASEYRPGSSISVAASNGSYKGRIMASHFTGFLKNDWALAFSLSTRFAKEGAIDGTPYNSYSAFFSAEKKINNSHSLNLTAIYAFNRRGKSSPNTQEVLSLKGGRYNSYWGFQDGKKRNSRIQKVEEPIVLLCHYWEKDKTTTLSSSVSYQFGSIHVSRLGYANVGSPDPSYYKYLPSAALQNSDFSEGYRLAERFRNDGQLDWLKLYDVNALIDTAGYYLYQDKNKDDVLSFNTVFNTVVMKRFKMDIGLSFRHLKSLNYALVQDVLGGVSFLDVDSFEEGDASQTDLNNMNRLVTSGDKFSYNYEIRFFEVESFFQMSYRLKKIELVGAVKYAQSSFQRIGFYKNGKHPSSFGKGTKKRFNNLSAKCSVLFKFSGRHLLYGNLALFSRAPVLKNMYLNIRDSNRITPEIRSETIHTVDINYQYRAPRVKSRCTAYYTRSMGGSQNSFLFAEGLKGENSDFITQSLTNIEKQNFGIELGIEIELSAEFSMSIVSAVGQYTYNNNPNLYVASDLFDDNESNFGEVFLKDYKLGGTPQRASSIGISYRNPNYWWVALNGNYITHHYLSISPLLRTANFYLDTDGIPFLDETSGAEVSKEQISELLKQERFDALFLVNMLGGKSWKLKENYLGLFISVNNILGEFYKTGGFEQARKANYRELLEDKSLSQPLFGPKYWVQNGTSYYLMLSYRF